MELSKFPTKKTKFNINFSTFKMAKDKFLQYPMFSTQKILEII